MSEIIIFIFVTGLAGLLIAAARQPDDFQISRSLLISAPAPALFSYVNNLHKWEAWSPWAKLDPNAVNSFEGPEEGASAKMSWAGNNKVGKGSMTILASRPYECIQFQLDFLKPMKATNRAEFSFKPEGSQIRVTWSMLGTNTFPAKLIGLLINCDKMVGGQFEQGLASLKTIVESESLNIVESNSR